VSRHRRNLVFRPYDRDLGIERLAQGAGRNFGSDAAGISERYR
jgi:hypothetical protein